MVQGCLNDKVDKLLKFAKTESLERIILSAKFTGLKFLQSKVENAALAFMRLHPHLSTMPLHDVFTERQPEVELVLSVFPAFPYVKNVRNLRRLDADAVITH